jgi:hypothetical protein
MRAKSDRPKSFRNGEVGYIHKIGESMTTTYMARPKRMPRVPDAELHIKFGPLCRSWYVNQSERIEQLAKILSVPPWALDAMHVGWDGEAWTFPEQNSRGQIVGVTRRFVDGSKLCVVGSRRGLTYADDWADGSKPIFIVEGGSDVAAGIAMGLSVIGRPSNVGGVDYLVPMLSKHDRPMIVVGERDQREHESLAEIVRKTHDPKCTGCRSCWPGKAGAVSTSNALSKRLNRLVQWGFVPDGMKDLRAWLVSRGANPLNQIAMDRIGASFVRRMKNAERL